MQPTVVSFRWWNPARSLDARAVKRLNFSSWRWQATQKRSSRSLTTRPARKRPVITRAPTLPPAHSASRRTSGERWRNPAEGRLVDRDGHRLGEYDARRRAGGASTWEHLASRRRHRPDG